MLLMRRALASGRYPGFSVAALPIATVFVPVHEGRYGRAGPSLSMSLPSLLPSPSFMRVLESPSGRETATHTHWRTRRNTVVRVKTFSQNV